MNVLNRSKNKDKKLNANFLLNLAQLEITEFLGVARILKVDLFNEDESPKSFVDVYQEIMEAFSNSNRTRRRELAEIVEKASKRRK